MGWSEKNFCWRVKTEINTKNKTQKLELLLLGFVYYLPTCMDIAAVSRKTLVFRTILFT